MIFIAPCAAFDLPQSQCSGAVQGYTGRGGEWGGGGGEGRGGEGEGRRGDGRG